MSAVEIDGGSAKKVSKIVTEVVTSEKMTA
jgi:hypothetical protein